MRALAIVLVGGILLAGLSQCRAQVSVGSQSAGLHSAAAAKSAGPPDVGVGAGRATAADTRTEKQRALAKQTERLFDMATELKVQVDKTNRNILSLKVVEKAEEIEALAKGMKAQAKR